MAYQIHDWRDRSKYPSDPLTGAPAAFIEERQEWGQSKDEIRSALWHWQFLRRHELYQHHWENDGDEYFDAFGMGGVPRPSPKDDFPMDLLFNYERKHLRYQTFIDAQKSWAENEIRLKQLYNLFRASKSAFDIMMASLYVRRGTSIGTRQRSLSEKKYPHLLRVLDALAKGDELIEIAKVIRPALHKNERYRAALRLQKSALDLQAELTQLPYMDKIAK